MAAQQRRSRLLLLEAFLLLTRTVNEKMDVLAAWLPRSEGGEPWFDRRFQPKIYYQWIMSWNLATALLTMKQ